MSLRTFTSIFISQLGRTTLEGCVYCITFLPDGRRYVGQTSYLVENRFAGHLKDPSSTFGPLFRKHPVSDFKLETLETIKEDDYYQFFYNLMERENYWMKTLKPELNITKAEHQDPRVYANTKVLGHVYTCDQCLWRFYTDVSRDYHMYLAHGGLNPHLCPTCKCTFKDIDSIISHCRIEHEHSWSLYTCKQCGHYCEDWTDLVIHRIRLHPCFVCYRPKLGGICIETFATREEREQHFTDFCRLKCVYCIQDFTKRDELRGHHRICSLKPSKVKTKRIRKVKAPKPPKPSKKQKFLNLDE